jgi:hypothetical protein
MGLPAHDEELDTPPLEEDDAPEAPNGLDVELDDYAIPESDPDDGELLDLGSGEEIGDESESPHDDGGPNLIPDEAVQLLELPELPERGDDLPAANLDAGDDLLGDDRSTDDGGEEGFADEDDELDDRADGSDAADADGADGIDVSSDEALPPWAEVRAARTEAAGSDMSFDVSSAPANRKELAVGADADGTRLVVMDEEDGAVFLRGDVVVSDLVPELPLAGVGILAGRPIYWVEGDGLYDGHVYIPGTQGLVALAAAPQGLLLALSARGEHALALLRPGSSLERIADLRSAALELRVRGQVVAVSAVAGLEVFTLA